MRSEEFESGGKSWEMRRPHRTAFSIRRRCGVAAALLLVLAPTTGIRLASAEQVQVREHEVAIMSGDSAPEWKDAPDSDDLIADTIERRMLNGRGRGRKRRKMIASDVSEIREWSLASGHQKNDIVGNEKDQLKEQQHDERPGGKGLLKPLHRDLKGSKDSKSKKKKRRRKKKLFKKKHWSSSSSESSKKKKHWSSSSSESSKKKKYWSSSSSESSKKKKYWSSSSSESSEKKKKKKKKKSWTSSSDSKTKRYSKDGREVIKLKHVIHINTDGSRGSNDWSSTGKSKGKLDNDDCAQGCEPCYLNKEYCCIAGGNTVCSPKCPNTCTPCTNDWWCCCDIYGVFCLLPPEWENSMSY